MNGRNLVIIAVNEASQAERLGIKAGDIIVSYNGILVPTITAFTNAVLSADENGVEVREILILRDGQELKFDASTEKLGFNYNEILSNKGTSQSVLENKREYETEYGVAHRVSSFVSFLGWVLGCLGVIVVFVAISSGLNSRYASLSLMSVVPGIYIAVSGFLMIMGAQVTRAIVDNADYTREILKAIDRRNGK